MKTGKDTAKVLNKFLSNIVSNAYIPQYSKLELTSEKINKSVVKTIVKYFTNAIVIEVKNIAPLCRISISRLLKKKLF